MSAKLPTNSLYIKGVLPHRLQIIAFRDDVLGPLVKDDLTLRVIIMIG